MSLKRKMLIYNWEGVFTPFVAGYAYFIVDQLQSHDELKSYLDHQGGRWVLRHQTTIHPVLQKIQHTIEHLSVNDKMQLARFVETHKSNLLNAHDKRVTIPHFLLVKMV